GDGICADVDCNDNNPNITTQPGDPCNDGNPATNGETIQADCSCGGGTALPTSTCSTVMRGSDDAEQRLSSGSTSLTSSDLELGTDGVSQILGMRFNGLNIPQGAFITNAYIQFTVDEAVNDNPCNLAITGQANDNAPTFAITSFNISNRPRTNSTVNWTPAQWTAVGLAGPAQQTPDLSSIIQEIVNRPGYTSASSIVLIIEGSGRRTAESSEAPAGAPRLCVDYFNTPPVYDCPSLSANFGSPCDDGDNTTINDVVDGDCNCAGTPTACTGFGDADGDGVCANVDCNDNNPNVTHQPGDACNDGNPATVNDAYDLSCNCAGVLNSCPNIGDADGDGICADVDCNDNNPAITSQPGDPCNDGNPNTVGETIQADCSCGGGNSTPTLTCSRVSSSSDDAEEHNGSTDLTSSDLELANDPSAGLQTIGMRFNGLNIPKGAVIANAYIQFTVDEKANDNPCVINIYGQAADNAGTFLSSGANVSSRPRTNATASWQPPTWVAVGDAGPAQKTPDIGPIIQEIVNRSGYTSASSIAIIMDGTGRRTAEAFNGSAPQAPELCVSYLYAPVANRQAPPSVVSVEGMGVEQNTIAPDDLISPISIYPNPATNQLTVAFASSIEGEAHIQARSLNGQVVIHDIRAISKGKNTILLEGLSLPDGLYFLQLFTGDTLQFEKFVIQHE
ncbi:MAG: T9SS type A sorting domain-containing protein, partial [Phaeodactylibacter sp.]|nr:T9SS type A sorting domain-containing protein [Phaeodactylibacter sp.]